MTIPRARTRTRRGVAIAAVLSAALVAGACTSRVHNQGYRPDPEALARIEPGVHNQVEVADFLGTPSNRALFGSETWFYITEKSETVAFFKPDIVEQRVVAIAFDDRGIVEEIAEYELEDGVPVTPVAEETPTYGKQLGLLEQLLGNIGRFGDKTVGGP